MEANINDFFDKFYSDDKYIQTYRSNPKILDLIIYTDYIYQVYLKNKSNIDEKEINQLMNKWKMLSSS